MKYTLLITKSADKVIQKLPKETIRKVEQKLAQLKRNPHLGKPLTGKLKSLWSLRILKYRAIYMIEEEKVSVYIIKFDHRKNVYD